jgi:hypothetical protein
MVREVLASAVPAGSKPQQRRLRKLAVASVFIDQILEAARAGFVQLQPLTKTEALGV